MKPELIEMNRSYSMKYQIKSILMGMAIVLAPMAMSSSAMAGETVLTNNEGMTLYTFDKDSQGMSHCYDGCAAKWPPFNAGKNSEAKEGYSFTTRKDGSQQWTYADKPLYTWVGDRNKGDTTGDGVGGVWHTAKKTSDSSY
jgi:predicted lipoprotein with Yx(FWY)xxD motif